MSHSFAVLSGSPSITAPFVINGDNTISQPIQTIVATQRGEAIYTFNITDPGNYIVSAMVNCLNGGSNSFFVIYAKLEQITLVIAPSAPENLHVQ